MVYKYSVIIALLCFQASFAQDDVRAAFTSLCMQGDKSFALDIISGRNFSEEILAIQEDTKIQCAGDVQRIKRDVKGKTPICIEIVAAIDELLSISNESIDSGCLDDFQLKLKHMFRSQLIGISTTFKSGTSIIWYILKKIRCLSSSMIGVFHQWFVFEVEFINFIENGIRNYYDCDLDDSMLRECDEFVDTVFKFDENYRILRHAVEECMNQKRLSLLKNLFGCERDLKDNKCT